MAIYVDNTHLGRHVTGLERITLELFSARALAPLDIVPVSGGESGPLVGKPRGPIETVVAKVGDVTNGIKNTAVATVTGITGWFASTGDKLFGREKTPPAAPTSRLSSSAD